HQAVVRVGLVGLPLGQVGLVAEPIDLLPLGPLDLVRLAAEGRHGLAIQVQLRRGWLMRGHTTDFRPVPGAGEERPRRTQVGIPRLTWWRRRWIGLLLLALIVFPWLPTPGPTNGAMPARRVRGVGDPAILTFAFAPDGATIATIQMDGRVALRDVAGGGGGAPALCHR